MKALPQFLKRLFSNDEVKAQVTTVQTALEPFHEEDIYQGGEFLDDRIREEDDDNEQVS